MVANLENAFSEKVPEEILQFFKRLGEATSSLDKLDVTEFISVDGILSGIEKEGGFENLSPAQKTEFTTTMKSEILKLGWLFNAMPFEGCKVRYFEQSTDQHALVFVRLYGNDYGIVRQMKCWLLLTEEGWKIYDFEELSQGQRTVKLMAILLRSGVLGEEEPWVKDFLSLTRKMRFIDAANPASFSQLEGHVANLQQQELPIEVLKVVSAAAQIFFCKSG